MYNQPQPKLLNINKIPGQPKRRKKITLVFDEEKRREFLGGFRKRKLERKRKAEEQLQQDLKEERKKIKQNAREHYKTLVSYRNIPELEELLSRQEYDLKDHTVSILELNIADLAEGDRWIGLNKPTEEKKQGNEDIKHFDNADDDDEEIVGMSLQEKHEDLPRQETLPTNEKVKSSKEVKRAVKIAALKQVKNSKAFRQKQKIEQQKNRKRSRQKLHKVQKLTSKRGKRVGKKSER